MHWSTAPWVPPASVLVCLSGGALCGGARFGDALDLLELVKTTEDTTKTWRQTNGSAPENFCRMSSEAEEWATQVT